jgi:hypothetical protein
LKDSKPIPRDMQYDVSQQLHPISSHEHDYRYVNLNYFQYPTFSSNATMAPPTPVDVETPNILELIKCTFSPFHKLSPLLTSSSKRTCPVWPTLHLRCHNCTTPVQRRPLEPGLHRHKSPRPTRGISALRSLCKSEDYKGSRKHWEKKCSAEYVCGAEGAVEDVAEGHGGIYWYVEIQESVGCGLLICCM